MGCCCGHSYSAHVDGCPDCYCPGIHEGNVWIEAQDYGAMGASEPGWDESALQRTYPDGHCPTCRPLPDEEEVKPGGR